ncbi:MAG: YHYH domain-containing protein [Candidatus Poribacteria bacterium]|nr:YHYH domain-containing protein [Candidatus Poribacteria bacterium]
MFRKVLVVFSLMLVFGMLLDDSAYTHSGRTDANGGHYSRKTGMYHYHNSGRSRTWINTTPTTPRTDAGANVRMWGREHL